MLLSLSPNLRLAGSPRCWEGRRANGSAAGRWTGWAAAFDAAAFGRATTAFCGAAAAFWLNTVITRREEGVTASKKGTEVVLKDAVVVQEAAAGGKEAAAAPRKDAAGVPKGMAAILKTDAAR